MPDPSPRVNATVPVPAAKIAAQYETSGPQRSSSLELGSTGVSLVAACTVESDPKRTNATAEARFVISTDSPPPKSATLADAVVATNVIVAAG